VRHLLAPRRPAGRDGCHTPSTDCDSRHKRRKFNRVALRAYASKCRLLIAGIASALRTEDAADRCADAPARETDGLYIISGSAALGTGVRNVTPNSRNWSDFSDLPHTVVRPKVSLVTVPRAALAYRHITEG